MTDASRITKTNYEICNRLAVLAAVVIHDVPEVFGIDIAIAVAVAREEHWVSSTGEGTSSQTGRRGGDRYIAVVKRAGGTARAGGACGDSGEDTVCQIIRAVGG